VRSIVPAETSMSFEDVASIFTPSSSIEVLQAPGVA
jgi:hypothetical protein